MNNSAKKSSSIIYVNFVPYENAGNIFTYLLDTYTTVISFTFNFHKISETQKQSRLTIYRNKHVIYSCRLFQTSTTQQLAFLLLPVRSIVILAQLLYHLIRLRKQFGPYDTYFTVNALTAWAGNILRSLHLVTSTIFWIWDYYPPNHEDKIVMFMRALYWYFDKPATQQSNKIVFLNKRLAVLRKQMCVLPKNKKYKVVGIGTNPIKKITHKATKDISLVFLGVLKKSQGLELFFSSAHQSHTLYPSLTLHIIGGGPDEFYYRKLAQTSPISITFHGYIENEKKVDALLSSCDIGLAPYIPDKDNVAYYSDPSKIKRYLEMGLPVITTNVFSFSSEIKVEKAGIIITYETRSLLAALKTIIKNYSAFQIHALETAKKYHYQLIYPSMFSDIHRR